MSPTRRLTVSLIRSALRSVEVDPDRYAFSGASKQAEIWFDADGDAYEREQIVLRQVCDTLRAWGYDLTGVTTTGNGSRLCLDWSGVSRHLILDNID